jgi:ribosome production factor 2
MGRIFDEHILDMVEFGFDNFKSLDEFKVSKIAVGTKPIIIFSGEPFDVQFEYQRIKNLLLDFFSGPIVESIRLSGLEHVINFVAADGKILMRSYKVLLKKSGTRWPRIELEEIGPRIDLTLRRTHLASQDLFKRSLRQPEELKKKSVKNINKDKLGSTLGRIHLQRQDYNKLQLRKLKAFKNALKDNPNKGKKRSLIPTEDNNNNNNNNNNNEEISVNKETNDSINNDNKEIVSTSVNPKKKVRFSL